MNNKQAKVFIRTLFNKNHIKVEDMEYTANTNIPTETYIEYNILTSKREGPNVKKYLKKPKIYRIRKKEYVKEISKLGFWYYRPCTKYDLEREVKASSITYEDIIHEIKIIGGKHTYTITYLWQYNNVLASEDQRPWDISPEGSMADHFVTDLLKIMDSIFDYAAAKKLKLRTRKYTYIQDKGYQDYYDYSDLNDFKRKIYTELFGAPKGPIYQTDAEKIQSHGFDNKISFRKRKED